MSSEVMSRIFDPFFTTKSLSAKKGTGLGLALAWHNIQAHSGCIDVLSSDGKGTTFVVYLPIPEEDNHEEFDHSASIQLTSGGNGILLVDDEPLVCQFAGDLLAELGYTIYTASDGHEALELYQEYGAAIIAVILDISMPGMDGKVCMQKLRELSPDVPILLATGHDVSHVYSDLVQQGANDVLQKPFRAKELATKLKSLLAPETL